MKLVLVLLALVSGCKEKSDRELIDALLDQTIAAANEKHAGEVVEHATTDFKGPHGADAAECRRILTGYFLQHGWVRVFELSRTVDIDGTSAKVKLEVTVAVGRDVQELKDLIPTNGTRLDLDLTLEKRDGSWQYRSAEYTQR